MKSVYKIWNKKENKYSGSYSRACHDEYDFSSEESALNANCHGIFKDTDTYEIHRVEVIEEVREVLPPKKEHFNETKKNREFNERVKNRIGNNVGEMSRLTAVRSQCFYDCFREIYEEDKQKGDAE